MVVHVTLVITLQNQDSVIQFSDRRLTGAGGPVDEEFDKAAVLVTGDTRLVMGFTGLASARVGSSSIDIARTAAELLSQAGPPDFSWRQMQFRFAEALSELFQQDRRIRGLPAVEKRTSFHFAGFEGVHPSRPVATFISNYVDRSTGIERPEAAEAFTCFDRSHSRTLWVEPLGDHHHLTRADVEPLARMVLERRPAEAIVNKGVVMMNQWAQARGADGPIGRQLTSIVLTANGTVRADVRYHTAVAQARQYMTKEIWVTPDRRFITADGYIEPVDGSNSVFPKVGRNHPCPCGSGDKYKRCHGQ